MPGVIYQLDCALFANSGETPAEVLEFVKANGLDPDVVPGDAQLVIRERGDGLWLQTRRVVLGEDGNAEVCPNCAACVRSEPVEVRLRVLPPSIDEAFVARPISADELATIWTL